MKRSSRTLLIGCCCAREINKLDRRRFLYRAGATALVAPAVPFLACSGEPVERPQQSGALAHPGGDITRPVLLPFSDGAVHLSAPPPELPVAYVSMGRRQVYLDHDYRVRVY